MGNCQPHSEASSRKDPVLFNQQPSTSQSPVIRLNTENTAPQDPSAKVPADQVNSFRSYLSNTIQTAGDSNHTTSTGIINGETLVNGRFMKPDEISRRIDEQLVKDHRANERVVKLLLLGEYLMVGLVKF